MRITIRLLFLLNIVIIAHCLGVSNAAYGAEIIISQPTEVNSDLTISADDQLTFAVNGYYVIAPHKTLTIVNGATLKARPLHIFRGGGTVVFQKATPPNLYPEWFGVVPNSSNLTVQTANVAALQKLINVVAAAGGGSVYFAAGNDYYFNGGLTYIRERGLTFTSAPTMQRARLIYTASGATPFMRLDSSQRVRFQYISFTYTSPTFTGYFITTRRAAPNDPTPGLGAAGDGGYYYFEDCIFEGSRRAYRAEAFIRMQQAIHLTVERCQFYYANNAIVGWSTQTEAPSDFDNVRQSAYMNVASVRDSLFARVKVAIHNPGQAWVVEGNNFEPYDPDLPGGATNVGITMHPTALCYGLNFNGNWVGDASQAATFATISGYGNSFNNNYVELPAGSFFIESRGGEGLIISGNRVAGGTSGIKFTTHATRALVFQGNSFNMTDVNHLVRGPGGVYVNHVISGNMNISDSFSNAATFLGPATFSGINTFGGATTFSNSLTANATVKIGSSGSDLSVVTKGTISINPTGIAARAVSVQTFTLPGATVGDTLVLNPRSDIQTDLLMIHYRVSATNTVSIKFYNPSASTVDAASETLDFVLIR